MHLELFAITCRFSTISTTFQEEAEPIFVLSEFRFLIIVPSSCDFVVVLAAFGLKTLFIS